MDLVALIDEVDPEGLVVIMADHGGFVGMNATAEALVKMNDRDMIYSVFSSVMAVKWPNDIAPHYEGKLKSSVNLFRILFSYLSDDERYLEHLQEDASFLQVNEGAPEGTYKYIDNQGNIVFEKLE